MILVVLPASPWKDGGCSYGGVFFIEHLRLLQQLYEDVIVVTIRVLPFRQLFRLHLRPFSVSVSKHDGFTIYNLSLAHIWPSSYFLVQKLLSLYAYAFLGYLKLCRKKSPELILAHYLIFPGVFSYFLSRASSFRLPYLIFSHRRTDISLIPRWESASISRAVERATAVFAPSHSHASFLGSQFSESSIKVFPNPISRHFAVDEQLLKTAQKNRCLDVLNGRIVVLCVANLIPLKNTHIVLEGFARFLATNPSLTASLVFVGEGPLYASLRLQSSQLGLSDQVSFASYASSDSLSLRNRYLDSHLLVSASDRETFGMSVLEGLCLGLPCVVSKSGGPSDFFHDAYGVTLTGIDSNYVATAMSTVLTNYAFYAKNLLSFPRQNYFSRSLAPHLNSQLASLQD